MAEKDSKDNRDSRDSRDSRDNRGSRDSKDNRDSRDNRDSKDSRDNRDSRGSRFRRCLFDISRSRVPRPFRPSCPFRPSRPTSPTRLTSPTCPTSAPDLPVCVHPEKDRKTTPPRSIILRQSIDEVFCGDRLQGVRGGLSLCNGLHHFQVRLPDNLPGGH